MACVGNGHLLLDGAFQPVVPGVAVLFAVGQHLDLALDGVGELRAVGVDGEGVVADPLRAEAEVDDA